MRRKSIRVDKDMEQLLKDVLNEEEQQQPLDEAKCQRIEARLRKCISEKRSGISFVELRDAAAEDVRGDFALGKADLNIYWWLGMSAEFATAFSRIDKSGMIELRPTQLLVYLIDGATLSLPLAKQLRKYKEPHWLPVSIRLKGER
jgi:hypothetical protein